jgi:hypothetical protein
MPITLGERRMRSQSEVQVGRSRRRMRLASYIATAMGTTALASSADAGVISIDVAGKGLTGDNGGLGISLGGASKSVTGLFPPGSPGTLGVFAWGDSTTPLYYFAGFTGSNGLSIAADGGIHSTTVFASNAEIGPGARWSTDSFETGFNVYKYGYENKKPNFQNGFIGFRSQVGSDYYYGWLEVTWSNGSGWGGVFNILSGAYESTPNTMIKAGDTTGGGGGAVPEPASSAVVALLMGGTALRQWRKKRRDAESADSESLAS